MIGHHSRHCTLKPAGYGELISQDGSFHHGVYPERSRGDALGSTVQLANAPQAASLLCALCVSAVNPVRPPSACPLPSPSAGVVAGRLAVL